MSSAAVTVATGVEGAVSPNTHLQLDGPRVVSFKDKGHAYTYHLPRISAADWQKFFEGALFESERASKHSSRTRFDQRSPGVEMVRRLVQKVEGYAGQLPANFRDILPHGHVVKVSEMLQDVRFPESRPEGPMSLGGIEVRLVAAWGSSTPGAMVEYDVVHRFHSPTVEQERKYLRSISEAEVMTVGGDRRQRTRVPSKCGALIKLYDELIAEVEGYAVNGQTLTPAQVAAEMDAFHKVCAVQQVFATPDDDDEAAAAGEAGEVKAA
jgi:hypothetical protein